MAIWQREISLEDIKEQVKNTLAEYIGIKVTEVGEDYLQGEMPVDRRTYQPHGILHGGASVALAETLGSLASTFCIDMDNQKSVCMEINANHVRPVSEGHVTGTARPVHLGRKSHIWEIRIRSEEGKLVSISRMTATILSDQST